MREIMVTRNPAPADDGGISFEEWQSYLARSPRLRVSRRATPGLDPFTRKPRNYYPGPGTAEFDSTSGTVTIGYHQGTLQASVPDDAAMEFITQIAADLHAIIEDSPV